MNKDEIIKRLRAALQEAVYELCRNCPSWDDANRECALRKKNITCWVQNHWKLLKEAK